MWVAAQRSNEAVVKPLLGTDHADVNPKNWDSQTPLSCAAYLGYESIDKLRLERSNTEVNSACSFLRAALDWVVRNKGEYIAKKLLEKDWVDVNLKNNDGPMPLEWAIRRGLESIVKLLLTGLRSTLTQRPVGSRGPVLGCRVLECAYGQILV